MVGMESMVGCIKQLHFSNSLLLAIILLVTALLPTSTNASATNGSLNCKGSVGDCYGEEEFATESEVSRRILQGKQYVTYPRLDRQACNNPPGYPYTQGRSGCLSGPVNRASGGCQKIHQCRSPPN